jgi:hypothetical protein
MVGVFAGISFAAYATRVVRIDSGKVKSDEIVE